jgi:hypothetical protein
MAPQLQRCELAAAGGRRTPMKRCLHVLASLVVMASQAGMAQDGDPSKSAECRQALDALQAQEARAASAPQAASTPRLEAAQALQAARKQAARACLGGHGEPPPPSAHFVQPLGAVAPPPALAAPAVRPAPVLLPPPAPVRAPAPVITGCDATGCYTSDGARVQRLGPGVIGPRGVCTVNGVTMSCP